MDFTAAVYEVKHDPCKLRIELLPNPFRKLLPDLLRRDGRTVAS